MDRMRKGGFERFERGTSALRMSSTLNATDAIASLGRSLNHPNTEGIGIGVLNMDHALAIQLPVDDVVGQLTLAKTSTMVSTANVDKAVGISGKRLKSSAIPTAVLFPVWFSLCLGFNLYGKSALNLISGSNLAYTTAWLQMWLGLLFYAMPLHLLGFRSKPKFSSSSSSTPNSSPANQKAERRRLLKKWMPVSIYHALGHLGGVVSMSAGAISFTYIIKSSEPAFSAAFLAILTSSYLPTAAYLSLMPVMAGVALTSASELTFGGWTSFQFAMISNVASALRGIVGKDVLDGETSTTTEITPVNAYALLTALSTVLLLPVVLCVEGPTMISSILNLSQSRTLSPYIIRTILSSIFFYTYNEVSFICLNRVSAVTHALSNTVKGIFTIMASMLFFGNRMTPRGIMGSAMAIGGVFMYSIAKNRGDGGVVKETNVG